MKNNKKDSKYPKTFSPYSQPYVRLKPQQIIKDNSIIETICLSNYEELPELDKDYKYFISVYGDSEDGYTIELEKRTLKEIPNPNYNQELRDYKKELERLNEWKEWKKIWDEEQKALEEAREKEVYQKLKEKYEKSNL